jgi:hypothetical protein
LLLLLLLLLLKLPHPAEAVLLPASLQRRH